jgi:tripartite-type tricarboxylate transporter receptor subunit TctC
MAPALPSTGECLDPSTWRAFVLGAAHMRFSPRSVAQAGFPSRALRIVIGFPPGGGSTSWHG